MPYLVSGAIVDTADGPIIFGISREIASHKRMEQEVIAAREAALAASQAKSEFLSCAYRKPHPGRCAEARVLEAHPEGASDRENRVGLLWMRTRVPPG